MLNTVASPQMKRAHSSHNSIAVKSDLKKLRSSQQALPPLRPETRDKDQENEMKNLIKRNLLMDAKPRIKNFEFKKQPLKEPSEIKPSISVDIPASTKSESRKEANDMLSQYFSMKKSLKA